MWCFPKLPLQKLKEPLLKSTHTSKLIEFDNNRQCWQGWTPIRQLNSCTWDNYGYWTCDRWESKQDMIVANINWTTVLRMVFQLHDVYNFGYRWCQITALFGWIEKVAFVGQQNITHVKMRIIRREVCCLLIDGTVTFLRLPDIWNRAGSESSTTRWVLIKRDKRCVRHCWIDLF